MILVKSTKKGRAALTSWLHIQMLPRLLRFTKISFFFQEHHGNHSSFRFFDSKQYSMKFFPNLRDMIILGVFQCLLDNVLLRMFFIDSILDIFVRMRVWNEYISCTQALAEAFSSPNVTEKKKFKIISKIVYFQKMTTPSSYSSPGS